MEPHPEQEPTTTSNLSETQEILIRHLNAAKSNIDEICKLVANDYQGKSEGLSIFMKLQHTFDDLGIVVSLLRPETYKNVIQNLVKKTLGNLTSLDEDYEPEKATTPQITAKSYSEDLIPLTSHIESYGLFNNEPLTAEGIIRGCFANRERSKFPDFAKRFWKGIKFCKSIKDADSLIRRIRLEIPNSEVKFNQAQIRLHDLSDFYAHVGNDASKEPVDKNEYLMTIKNSKWYGPYKLDAGDFYYFYAIDNLGKYEYFVDFVVYLNQSPCLFLYYHKNSSLIGQYKYFYNK